LVTFSKKVFVGGGGGGGEFHNDNEVLRVLCIVEEEEEEVPGGVAKGTAVQHDRDNSCFKGRRGRS
jgi:hypothetical protein